MAKNQKLLVANRGEIARRVFRTAHKLGMETVAVFADPDRAAPFVGDATESVHIGPADLSQSYLSVERIIDAANQIGATAVHPGYGFLSENSAFAQAVLDAGLTWVGPSVAALDAMGMKIQARRLATEAGVPIIPGFDESQDDAKLAAAAERIGYPVLVKAAAGGGGKGIRIVNDPAQFGAALGEARDEAKRSFGNDDMIVERYITRPRHVEVQIVGDRHGNVVDLGTRECSVQRRYQKLFEEAPAPNLPPETREGLRSRGRDLAASIGYDSAGTIEFIVDDASGDFFFLEMNTRLQVEHPVTELVTGLDLVEIQIRSAFGEPLGFSQDDVEISGHAVEARINAEDPSAGFAPQIGTISQLNVPSGVRWDSAIEQGSEVTPFYDPMLAKLIVGGADRDVALNGLAAALDDLVVGGITTNTGLHRWLLDRPELRSASITTRFLDENEYPGPTEALVSDAARVASDVWQKHNAASAGASPWSGSLSLTPHRRTQPLYLRHQDGTLFEVPPSSAAPNGGTHVVDAESKSVAVNVGGVTHTFSVLDRSEHWAPTGDADQGRAGAIVAPFPGVVTSVEATPGSQVSKGDVVVVIEAMKMLHSLTAAGSGTVAEVRVNVGDQVDSKQVLVTFADDAESKS